MGDGVESRGRGGRYNQGEGGEKSRKQKCRQDNRRECRQPGVGRQERAVTGGQLPLALHCETDHGEHREIDSVRKLVRRVRLVQWHLRRPWL